MLRLAGRRMSGKVPRDMRRHPEIFFLDWRLAIERHARDAPTAARAATPNARDALTAARAATPAARDAPTAAEASLTAARDAPTAARAAGKAPSFITASSTIIPKHHGERWFSRFLAIRIFWVGTLRAQISRL